LSLSGLSYFFVWGCICLAHIRFRSAWKAQGHVKAELPYEAIFGVGGSWYGFLLNILCMIATFYTALYVSSNPLSQCIFPLTQRQPACRWKTRPSTILPKLPRRSNHRRPLHRMEAVLPNLVLVRPCARDGHHVRPPLPRT
jgi:hypothetical protein